MAIRCDRRRIEVERILIAGRHPLLCGSVVRIADGKLRLEFTDLGT